MYELNLKSNIEPNLISNSNSSFSKNNFICSFILVSWILENKFIWLHFSKNEIKLDLLKLKFSKCHDAFSTAWTEMSCATKKKFFLETTIPANVKE